MTGDQKTDRLKDYHGGKLLSPKPTEPMEFIISTSIATVSLLLSLWLTWKNYINKRKIYKSITLAIENDGSENLSVTLYTQSSSPIQIFEWKVYVFTDLSATTHYSPNDDGYLILTIGKPVTFSFNRITVFNAAPQNKPQACYLKLRVVGRKKPIIKEVKSQLYGGKRTSYLKRKALIFKVRKP